MGTARNKKGSSGDMEVVTEAMEEETMPTSREILMVTLVEMAEMADMVLGVD